MKDWDAGRGTDASRRHECLDRPHRRDRRRGRPALAPGRQGDRGARSRPVSHCSVLPAMPACGATTGGPGPSTGRACCAVRLRTWHGTAPPTRPCTTRATRPVTARLSNEAQVGIRRPAGESAACGHRVVGLGGGHEIAWASYQGIAQALQDDARLARLGIVNFDAHFDLRKPEVAGPGTSGTPFLQIAEARAAAATCRSSTCASASAKRPTPAPCSSARDAWARDYVLDVDAGDGRCGR